jgi:hypothetical protein
VGLELNLHKGQLRLYDGNGLCKDSKGKEIMVTNIPSNKQIYFFVRAGEEKTKVQLVAFGKAVANKKIDSDDKRGYNYINW